MEKSETMKRYEDETGKHSVILKFMAGGQALESKDFPKIGSYDYSTDYIAWLEAKASAYDRLMSGGKKTLKELANFLGMNVAVEDEPIYGRRVFASPTKMFLKTNTTIYGTYKFWALSENGNIFQIPSEIVDFKGDWTTSLTLPDGWEENHDNN